MQGGKESKSERKKHHSAGTHWPCAASAVAVTKQPRRTRVGWQPPPPSLLHAVRRPFKFLRRPATAMRCRVLRFLLPYATPTCAASVLLRAAPYAACVLYVGNGRVLRIRPVPCTPLYPHHLAPRSISRPHHRTLPLRRCPRKRDLRKKEDAQGRHPRSP